MRFMGVEGLGNAPEEDFLSDAFTPRSPRLIHGGTAYTPKATRRDSGLCNEILLFRASPGWRLE